MPLPTNINWVVEVDKITEIWRKHYFNLFSCIRSNLNNLKYDVTFSNDMIVTAREAITKLDKNKACGQDRISDEHVMYASERILHMLAMCYTGFLIHGFLQENMISVILTAVIKNKTGKITSKDNYRPIALASVISKVF